MTLTLVSRGTGGSFSGTLTVPYIGNVNGAASTPALLLSGTIFTGGSTTTTKPQLLVEPTGTTSTGWSTAGTLIGANAATGFVGNLLDLQLNGVSKVKVDAANAKMVVYGTDISAASITFAAGAGTISANGLLTVGGNNNGTLFSSGNATVSADQFSYSFAGKTFTITSGYTSQRFTLFAQPTISAATSLTVTNAATVAIAGAPTATGAGPAVITNAYALWTQAGALRFDGNTQAIAAGALLFALAATGSGANNPATAAQNGWLQLEDSSGKFWVPIWR